VNQGSKDLIESTDRGWRVLGSQLLVEQVKRLSDIWFVGDAVGLKFY
jgi:hypothetical protein